MLVNKIINKKTFKLIGQSSTRKNDDQFWATFIGQFRPFLLTESYYMNSSTDWVTAFLLCSGSIIFMYSKEVAKCSGSCSESENSFGLTVSMSGFICLVIYVGADSFTSNWQENLFSHNVEGLELAFG